METVRPYLRALLAYTAVTSVLTYPLLLRLATGVPNDIGDPLLNIWILWWNSEQVPLTVAWWNAPAFFPLPDALALSEHLVGLSFLTTPIIWLSGNPLLAYNIAFVLTFVLSAMGAYALAVTVTGRHDVAFVAGLVYGFSPYRMTHLAHIQLLATFWMPFTLAALHRYLEDRRPRWLVLFAAGTALQGLTSGYYLFFFPVLVGLWVLWFAPPGRRLSTAGAVGGSWAAGSLLLVPFLLHYRGVHERLQLRRWLGEMVDFSPGVGDLLSADPAMALWGRWLGTPGGEVQLFPGLTCILLVAAALLWARGRAGPPEPASGLLPQWTRLALAGVASLLSLAALSRLALGPWRLELFGLTISTGAASKVLAQALYPWLIVALTGPRARRFLGSRSPLAFYVLATIVMWVLSFGPIIRIGDLEVLYWAPYRWLTVLPGFASLRVPARFAMLAVLCLSTAVALAMARLQPRLGRTAWTLLVALASVAILAEGWRGLPVWDPPRSSVLSAAAEGGAVIELPVEKLALEIPAVYRGIGHRHPVVNGYSGHVPASTTVLRLALPQRRPRLLRELARRGVRHVVVRHDGDLQGRWQRYVESYPGAKRVRVSGGQTLFSLAATSLPDVCDGPTLPLAGLDATVGRDDVGRVVDGDLDTGWGTGRPQARGDAILVDLGSVQRVGGLELALGRRYRGFPRRLAVEASIDGRAWTRLWRGSTGAQAFAAAIDDPRRIPLRLCFPSAPARHLRLRQLVTDPEFTWEVVELVVLGVDSEDDDRVGPGGTRPGR